MADAYDVVIVGGGIAGAMVAKRLAAAGQEVLVLEAGDAGGRRWATYRSYVERYQGQLVKVPNAPYPNPPQAPSPTVLDITNIPPDGPPDTNGYFVQCGPVPFGSDYQRSLGGTTLHWFGLTPRMLPPDFEMASTYGVGVDWPLTYDDLVPWYEQAEAEIGVAGEVAQRPPAEVHREGYVFPMHAVPPSYLDQTLGHGLNGTTVRIDDHGYPLTVATLPQARNTIPNRAFDGGKGYRPVGAVGRPLEGQRCEGNSSCIPICPVQAKYSALKTIAQAEQLGVRVITQAVVTKLDVRPGGTGVTGVTYLRWPGASGAPFDECTVTARLVVLAAHAVENVKVLFASGAHESDQLGRNLMDHPFMQAWALMPQAVGAFRGPGTTSGIENLRDGDFRRNTAAFRTDIGNWGWDLSGSPYADVETAVRTNGLVGTALREYIACTVPRQMRLGFLLEQLPSPDNRVTFDSGYTDALGLPRPVIHYHIDDYTRAGAALARRVSKVVFGAVGATDHTSYDPSWHTYVKWKGQGFALMGAGHLVGTHRLSDRRDDGVVDVDQRHWQLRNVFVVGAGSMRTIGTSNPTLTLTALALRSVPAMLEVLG